MIWLDTIGDFSKTVAGVPASKLRSLASQAMSLDAANLKETLPEKRYTLMVALLLKIEVDATRAPRFMRPWLFTLSINATVSFQCKTMSRWAVACALRSS